MSATPYGRFDRALHRIAFRSLGPQRRLAEVESRMFRDRIEPAHARRPVFVTALPRAGTTMLLGALAGLPGFATATYRHMPFPLLPLLWTDASRRFQQDSRPAERAHGDGVAVGYDSPEAFEELLWLAFWPRHYQGGTIRPWTAGDRDPEFEAFFRQHMAKVVAAGPEGADRYLSKNNANIARLPLLAAAFPDAHIVVPVRDPWAQAASLLRQHRRFLELHARDGFAQAYMEGIGHFEFGRALRPIAFGDPDPRQAETPAFWLTYWADAYEAVLAAAGPQVVFVDHDRLSAEPGPHLHALAAAIGAGAGPALDAAARRFRPGSAAERPEAPAALLDRVAWIHRRLTARCLAPAEAAA
jgi:Sulfotransferase family